MLTIAFNIQSWVSPPKKKNIIKQPKNIENSISENSAQFRYRYPESAARKKLHQLSNRVAGCVLLVSSPMRKSIRDNKWSARKTHVTQFSRKHFEFSARGKFRRKLERHISNKGRVLTERATEKRRVNICLIPDETASYNLTLRPIVGKNHEKMVRAADGFFGSLYCADRTSPGSEYVNRGYVAFLMTQRSRILLCS